MCDGASLSLICRMYSPRSVSTGVTPAASSARLSCISSDTMDLDLMTFFTSCFFAISTTSLEACSAVSAYRTVAPRRVASFSKVASQTSRFSMARMRRSMAASRVPSKSSSSVMAFALAATNLVANFFIVCCRRWSASFCPARALKCMV